MADFSTSLADRSILAMVQPKRIGYSPRTREQLRDIARANAEIEAGGRLTGSEPIPAARTPIATRPLSSVGAPLGDETKISQLVDWYKMTDKKVINTIADTVNVKPKTVETVGLLSLVGTGAGLLANGVKSLFDGTLKAKRAERKAEKAAKKQSKTASAMAEAYSIASGQGTPAAGGPLPPGGQFSMANIGGMLQKYWWAVLLLVVVLFKDKIFKPKRRAPRRRPAPKVVTRYRTRKPATRKRR